MDVPAHDTKGEGITRARIRRSGAVTPFRRGYRKSIGAQGRSAAEWSAAGRSGRWLRRGRSPWGSPSLPMPPGRPGGRRHQSGRWRSVVAPHGRSYVPGVRCSRAPDACPPAGFWLPPEGTALSDRGGGGWPRLPGCPESSPGSERRPARRGRPALRRTPARRRYGGSLPPGPPSQGARPTGPGVRRILQRPSPVQKTGAPGFAVASSLAYRVREGVARETCPFWTCRGQRVTIVGSSDGGVSQGLDHQDAVAAPVYDGICRQAPGPGQRGSDGDRGYVPVHRCPAAVPGLLQPSDQSIDRRDGVEQVPPWGGRRRPAGAAGRDLRVAAV